LEKINDEREGTRNRRHSEQEKQTVEERVILLKEKWSKESLALEAVGASRSTSGGEGSRVGSNWVLFGQAVADGAIEPANRSVYEEKNL